MRSWVGITDAGDTSQDAVLERIADAVSEFIERYTRRKFVTRAVTEYHDGDGSRKLFLKFYPVTTFTSLKIRRSPTDTNLETVSTNDYRCDNDRGIVHVHSDVLTYGVNNVEAVYSVGYGAQDANTLPSDVVLAGLDLIKVIYNEKAHGAQNVQSFSLGNSNFLLKPNWPQHIKDTLDAWRRPMGM